MRVMALETSTLAGGVALLEDGQPIAELSLDVAFTHSERLMAMIDQLLRDCRWTVRDLRGLAVSVGPGSFTGLRVGIATAKGLALALDLPIAPVPTLDALAARLPFADAPVCPVLDARKGEVYLSLYVARGQGEMERLWDYLALAPRVAAERLEAPVILVGNGVPACLPHVAPLESGVRIAPPALSLPSAAVVGQIGHAMLLAGQGVSGDELAPQYLRPSEAELKARHG